MRKNHCFLWTSFLMITLMIFEIYAQETGADGLSGVLLPCVLTSMMAIGALALRKI